VSIAAAMRPRVRSVASAPTAPGFYVSPTGTASNDGSIGSPWSLAYALGGAGGAITPGSTVWLLSGAYTLGTFSANPLIPSYQVIVSAACSGTAVNRVTFRGVSSLPSLMPVLKGDLHVLAAYTTWRDIRQTWDFDTDRVSASGGSPVSDVPRQHSGFWPEARDIWCVNYLIHDTGGGFGAFSNAPGFRTFDSFSYNNGWIGNDRGHGHAFYQQSTANPTLPADVQRHHALTTFSNFGAGGKFAGSDGNSNLRGFEMAGCTLFDSGTPVRSTWQAQPAFLIDGAATRKGNVNITGCSFWMRDSAFHDYNAATRPVCVWIGDVETGAHPVTMTGCRIQGRLRFGAWNGLTFTDNMVTMGNDQLPWTLGVAMVQLQPAPSSFASYSWLRNRYLHTGNTRGGFLSASTMQDLAMWRTATTLDADSTYTTGQLTAPEVQLVPSEVETGKATLTIWNQPGAATVNVDVSSVLTPGQSFTLHHVYDYVSGGAPTLSGTYSGVSLSVPMTAKTPPPPQGWTALPDLPNTFGVFILRTL
jgi:hypothetical protein